MRWSHRRILHQQRNVRTAAQMLRQRMRSWLKRRRDLPHCAAATGRPQLSARLAGPHRAVKEANIGSVPR